jgi:hypothetical protein
VLQEEGGCAVGVRSEVAVTTKRRVRVSRHLTVFEPFLEFLQVAVRLAGVEDLLARLECIGRNYASLQHFDKTRSRAVWGGIE